MLRADGAQEASAFFVAYVEMKVMEVMPDYIYLFLECEPRIAMHQVIKKLKGATFHILKEEYPSLKIK